MKVLGAVKGSEPIRRVARLRCLVFFFFRRRTTCDIRLILVASGICLRDRGGGGSIVGAGSVVTKGTVIPPNSLVMGIPGKVVRTLEPGTNLSNAKHYVIRKDLYLEDK